MMHGGVGSAEVGARRAAEEGRRLQRFTLTGRLVNLTAFGKELSSFCRRQYEWYVPRSGHGFQDGGCLVLAQAVVDWSGGAMRLQGLLAARSRCAQHVVARHGGVLLDSDGAGTEEDMRRKWLRFEGDADVRVLDFPEGFPPGRIKPDGEASARIAKGLRARFGAYGPESVPTG